MLGLDKNVDFITLTLPSEFIVVTSNTQIRMLRAPEYSGNRIVPTEHNELTRLTEGRRVVFEMNLLPFLSLVAQGMLGAMSRGPLTIKGRESLDQIKLEMYYDYMGNFNIF